MKYFIYSNIFNTKATNIIDSTIKRTKHRLLYKRENTN